MCSLKETMEWTPDQEVHIIKKEKKCEKKYILISHDHSMQFVREKRSLNSLMNSGSHSICKT